jgi:hypothetical protein
MFSALLMCLPRELIDQWHGWPIGAGKLLDIGIFVLGGLAAGILFLKVFKKREKVNCQKERENG